MGTRLAPEAIEQYLRRLRHKVAYHVGGFCPDLEDIVQESISRFLAALKNDTIRKPQYLGTFLNGICNNVIHEYRRRLRREPMVEPAGPPAEPAVMPEADLLEAQDAIAAVLQELSSRDYAILHAFYLEEKSKEEICRELSLTDLQFRVALFRAKDRFRQAWRLALKHTGSRGH